MPPKREFTFTPAICERLADLITAEDDQKVLAVLREAMSADLTVRAPRKPKPKPGEPKAWRNDYVIMPDHRVRICAAKIMAEIKHGKARQSVDINVNALNQPLPRAEAAREMLESWDDIKRIGDEHVRYMKQALPAPQNGSGVHDKAQDAEAEIVDVELEDE